MPTREEIITALKQQRFIERYAARFIKGAEVPWWDDIVAELYLYVCEKPAHLLERRYREGGMKAVKDYVAGIIVRQLNSKQSDIYYKYTRHAKREKPQDNIWDADQDTAQ